MSIDDPFTVHDFTVRGLCSRVGASQRGFRACCRKLCNAADSSYRDEDWDDDFEHIDWPRPDAFKVGFTDGFRFVQLTVYEVEDSHLMSLRKLQDYWNLAIALDDCAAVYLALHPVSRYGQIGAAIPLSQYIIWRAA